MISFTQIKINRKTEFGRTSKWRLKTLDTRILDECFFIMSVDDDWSDVWSQKQTTLESITNNATFHLFDFYWKDSKFNEYNVECYQLQYIIITYSTHAHAQPPVDLTSRNWNGQNRRLREFFLNASTSKYINLIVLMVVDGDCDFFCSIRWLYLKFCFFVSW